MPAGEKRWEALPLSLDVRGALGGCAGTSWLWLSRLSRFDVVLDP